MGYNFLNIPGDNDWNECAGYDIHSNVDAVREMWRENFAMGTSPFKQFNTDFPPPTGGNIDDHHNPPPLRPTIYRKDDNPEIYFFKYSNVAIFGLNRPDRESYISNIAPTDANEVWVSSQLSNDVTCSFQSIVLISHAWLKESLYQTIENEYFDRCNRTVPILSISGNTQPRSYCMSVEENQQLGAGTALRVNVTVEAFKSAPLLISVVRDPLSSSVSTSGGDYFHVEDIDLSDQNNVCPDL